MQTSAWQMMGTVALALTLVACGDLSGELVNESDASNTQALTGETFQVCETTPLTPQAPIGFSSWTNRVLSGQGIYPVSQDVVTLPNSDFNITGWFAMGGLRVGARNEEVAQMIDRCGTWDTVSKSITNRDGRARSTQHQMDMPGRYRLTQQLLANGTQISSTINVLPAGTHFVVFDIDGTLTTDNGQFVRQQLDPDYVPVAFDSAEDATQAWAAKGYVVLYLTGRPTDAAVATRAWLDQKGFARGPTHLTEQPGQVLPKTDGVGKFKKEFLQSLLDKGYIIDYAYGNETTDIYAYTGIGLSNDKIFILGPKAGTSGTQPLPTGYTENLPFIAQAPAAQQPFSL